MAAITGVLTPISTLIRVEWEHVTHPLTTVEAAPVRVMDGKEVAQVQEGGARGLLEKPHDEAGEIQRGHGLLRHDRGFQTFHPQQQGIRDIP